MAKVSTKVGAGLIAALGLSALSPVQQAGVALSVGAAALWATPALASLGIPGVGSIIKSGPRIIIAPSDANGEVRLTGLEPGDYTVQVFGGQQPVPLRVGRDGRLAFVAYEDVKRADPAAADPRARRAPPVVRRWAEQIPFDGSGGKLPDKAVVLDLRQSFTISPPVPCARPVPGVASFCPGRIRNFIDVNASSAEEMRRLAPTLSAEAAAFIVAERTRGGAFKDAQNFASRVCAKVAIDFDDASLQMGATTIVMKTGNPKSPGWKSEPRDNVVRLFGSRLSYVGHVTLLR